MAVVHIGVTTLDSFSLLFLPLNISPRTSVSLLVILAALTDQYSLHEGYVCKVQYIIYGKVKGGDSGQYGISGKQADTTQAFAPYLVTVQHRQVQR